MLPVEIVPVQESVVLRARGSELLILPHHVRHLKKSCEKPKDFSEYFRAEALVNRPARKLFEAWLRKDDTLWKRLYICIHKEMEIKAEEEAEEAPVKAKAKEEPKAKAEEKPAKEAKKEEPKAKAEEKPAKKEKAAKEEPKAKAKVKADDEKPAAKKKATKKVAKSDEEKPAAKKKTKTASAGAAKKKKG